MIKSFIPATKLVRAVLRSYGIESFYIYTNDYKKCKTVKTYSFRWLDTEKVEKDIIEVLTQAGYKDFSIKERTHMPCHGMGSVTALIVRLPKE